MLFFKTTIIPAEPTEILNKKQLAMIQIHEADYMPWLATVGPESN